VREALQRERLPDDGRKISTHQRESASRAGVGADKLGYFKKRRRVGVCNSLRGGVVSTYRLRRVRSYVQTDEATNPSFKEVALGLENSHNGYRVSACPGCNVCRPSGGL
jgi:hypothetical protein